MTTFAWPDFGANRFEMRVVPNFRVFPNPFTGTAQVIDLGGEHFEVSINLVPGNTLLRGGALEAFFDRLCGPVHRVALWNLRRPVPLGTLRDGASVSVVNGSSVPVTVVNGGSGPVSVVSGTPMNVDAIAIGANTTRMQTRPGRTLYAGDMLGLVNGQLVRVMADAVADSDGRISIEFLPRARTAIAAFGAVTWNKPTANFTLKSDRVPLTWRPGSYDSISLDLVEAS